MANTIEIVIKATDKASAVIKKIGDAAGPIGAGIAGGLLKANAALGQFQGLAQAVAGAPLTQLVVGLGKAAFELGTIGAQALRTEAAFERVVGGSQQAAQMLSELKEATRGTRSEAELMESATNLMALGLGRTSTDIANITRNVEALGARFGGTMQIFQLMMSNKSLMRIDSFGIGVAEATARIDAFKAAGMEADQAFDTAILELMTEKYTLLGGTVDDAVSANQRLQASWADLKAEIGKGLAPAVADATGFLADQAVTVNKLASIYKHAWQEYGLYAGGIQATLSILGFNTEMMQDLENKTRIHTAAVDRATQQAEYYIAIQEDKTEALREELRATGNNTEAWNQYSYAMQLTAEAQDASYRAANRLRDEMESANIARAADNWNMVKMAMQGALGAETESYIQNAGEIRDRMIEIRSSVYDLRKEQEGLSPSAQRYIDITKEIGTLSGEYDGLLTKLGELTAAHEEANKGIIFNMLEQRLALDGMTADEQDALSQLAADWGMIDEATLRALEGVAEVAEKMGEGAIKGEDLGEALEPLVSLGDEVGGALDATAGAADSASVNMGDAAQAARDLRAELALLESKTVTIDVVYNDAGLPSATVTRPGGGQTTYQANASGFEGLLTRPTMAMFAERGAEYVKAVPVGESTTNHISNGGDTIYINNGAQAMMVMERKARMRSVASSF